MYLSFIHAPAFFVLTFVTDSEATYDGCIFAFKEIMIFAGRLPTTSPIINHLLEGCRLNKKIPFRNMLCFGNDGQFNLVDELFPKIKNKIENFLLPLDNLEMVQWDLRFCNWFV